MATAALHRDYDISEFGVAGLDEESILIGLWGFKRTWSLRDHRHYGQRGHSHHSHIKPRVLSYIPESTFFDFARDMGTRLLEAGERSVGYQGNFLLVGYRHTGTNLGGAVIRWAL